MATSFEIFNEADLQVLRNLPEVKKTEGTPYRYFRAAVPDSIKQKLQISMGLDLSSVSSVPFRWVYGDTMPHIDRGQSSFENTYLVYLTDGEGQFEVGEETYPITAGTGFVFSEGTSHAVTHTNGSSRLLLGPMSEAGFSVGGAGIAADGETDTVYISQSGNVFSYKINDGDPVVLIDLDENPNSAAPIQIVNNNGDPAANVLKVYFATDITIAFQNIYFIILSAGIQIGSKSLKSDGTKYTVTIDGVQDYGGLIEASPYGGENTAVTNSYVYNLHIRAINASTLAEGGGWVGRIRYGKNGDENYIVGCSSDGPISMDSGGIVGKLAGEGATNLYINGCSTSGAIGVSSGGLAGPESGSSGTIRFYYCSSSGTIGVAAGGIVGEKSAYSGTCTVYNSYSIGTIGQNGGGIFGANAGEDGNTTAGQCYSRGNIAANGGGIFGRYAALNGGSSTVDNCYSSGTVTTSGNGYFGSNPREEGYTVSNSYSADGEWSDNDVDFDMSIFQSVGLNQPYELKNIGTSPYSLETIIVGEGIGLNTYYVPNSIGRGVSTAAVLSGYSSYSILDISPDGSSDTSSITINSTTGLISTTRQTPVDTYYIRIRAVKSNLEYTNTRVELTVRPIIWANGETDTLYILKENGTFYYRINTGSLIEIVDFPIRIQNIAQNKSTNKLKVLFPYDITVTGSQEYIRIASDGIQIGSETLRPNGSKCIITVDDTSYSGFIYNRAFSYISVYNLHITTTNGASLNEDNGWIGRELYGRNGKFNYIVGCSSDGPIPDFCGGIVGFQACRNSNSTLFIYGCSTSGTIGQSSGGIAGQQAGTNTGTITIEFCSSSGTIALNGGGIVGNGSGSSSGSCIINNCYSLGSIGENAGGIVGSSCSSDDGTTRVRNSYSRGNIAVDAGGIFGGNAAASGSGTATAVQCYSLGTVVTAGTGIFGTTSSENTGVSDCYVAEGAWINGDADTTLNITTIYQVLDIDNPYELRGFGPSPYSLKIINTDQTNTLTTTYSKSISVGSAVPAVLSGFSYYSFLDDIDPQTSAITINSTTGLISTLVETRVGTYTMRIRATTDNGEYAITSVVLTVVIPLPTFVPSGKGFSFQSYTSLQGGDMLVKERLENRNMKFKSFEDYNRYLKANASLR